MVLTHTCIIIFLCKPLVYSLGTNSLLQVFISYPDYSNTFLYFFGFDYFTVVIVCRPSTPSMDAKFHCLFSTKMTLMIVL
jgi:hypothetical protein